MSVIFTTLNTDGKLFLNFFGWTKSRQEIIWKKCHDISDAQNLRMNMSFMICHKKYELLGNEKDVKWHLR